MSTTHLTLSSVYTASFQPQFTESMCLLSAQFSVSVSSRPAPCCSHLPVCMLYLKASLLSTVCHLSCSAKNVLYCVNIFYWTITLYNYTSDMNLLVQFCPLQYLYICRHLCLFLIYHFMGHCFFTLSHFKRQEKFCINY